MEEEGELEGVESSGPAERYPRPQEKLFHLRGASRSELAKSKWDQRASRGKQAVGLSQSSQPMRLPGLNAALNASETHLKSCPFLALLRRWSMGTGAIAQW